MNIYAALSAEQSVDQVLADVGGKQFSEFKPMLSELAVEKARADLGRDGAAHAASGRN